MHAKSISKILACEYVKKHIKSQCEYHMKVYGYNPLDNPPQKCDNTPRQKGGFSRCSMPIADQALQRALGKPYAVTAG